MKNKTKNAMTTKMNGNILQVWLGKADEPESEFILSIDIFWVPTLISVLKQYSSTKR